MRKKDGKKRMKGGDSKNRKDQDIGRADMKARQEWGWGGGVGVAGKRENVCECSLCVCLCVCKLTEQCGTPTVGQKSGTDGALPGRLGV